MYGCLRVREGYLIAGLNGGGAGIRTLGAITLNGFQDRRFRPLSHPTGRGADYTALN